MRKLSSLIATAILLLLSARFANAQALTGSDAIGFNPKFTRATSTNNSINRTWGSLGAAGSGID